MSELQVGKSDITQTRLVSAGDDPASFDLAEGEILLTVERFSFTANNVTYGAIGEQIGYWKFFPPTRQKGDEGDDWGIVPVWGFGEVVASKSDIIEIGERVYGYLPMAQFVRLRPGRISDDRFVDVTPHRTELPAVYNNYDRLGKDSANAANDNLRALLNPLYGTSFCLCDALDEEAYRGAEQVVILSASSKTAIGLAFGLSQLEGERPSIIGLTSPANTDFVARVEAYDVVLGYDQIDKLENRPSLMVDMSGNRAVIGAVHALLGDNMLWCHNVGLTHWDDEAYKSDPAADQIIRDRSAMFFAPGHIERRAKEWGGLSFNQKVSGFLQGGIQHANTWIQVHETSGLDNFAEIYARVVAGDMRPEEGIIILP